MKKALAIVALAWVGCSSDVADKLVAAEMKCDWHKHSSFDSSAKRIFHDSYMEKKDKPGMKAAFACSDKDGDCAAFNTCRDAAAKLDGGE